MSEQEQNLFDIFLKMGPMGQFVSGLIRWRGYLRFRRALECLKGKKRRLQFIR